MEHQELQGSEEHEEQREVVEPWEHQDPQVFLEPWDPLVNKERLA